MITKTDAKRLAVVLLASLIMALNINTFVQTGGLYPGGVTGLTILLQRLAEKFMGVSLSFAITNSLLNLVPVYIGFRYLGKKFTLLSCVCILTTGLLTDFMPAHVITYDTLLISIFGGIINGFAISLCLIMDTTTGGTDFIAIYLTRKKGIDAWNLILLFNVFLLAAGGLAFGWDKALYSIFFQFATTHVIQALYRRYQKKTLFIVTDKPREVCDALYASCHHGATVLRGQGSYAHSEKSIVYSVVSGDEGRAAINATKSADPAAFINVIKTQELAG
ncbi:MAG: YitT family protein, partial [Mailhella sp.]|nr:YitT family protein [Mailhella sp.]